MRPSDGIALLGFIKHLCNDENSKGNEDEQNNWIAEYPGDSNNADAPVAPRARIGNWAGKMLGMARRTTAFTHTTKAFGQTLFGLPLCTKGVAITHSLFLG